jgi:hypothetical protein
VSTATGAPAAIPGQIVESGPDRRHHELVWIIRLPDGRRARLAQLVPELASEPALRQRFVHEVERLAHAGAPSLAETLAIGPQPDPRDPAAEPPWRVRLEPPGRRLDDWLGPEGTRRPVDEVVDVVAAVADALAGAHAAGLVLRDLEPRAIVLGDDGRVVLTDGGLARLGILSSRTASTLAFESSPWSAPEHARATVVDARADVFTLGALLHRALTGVLPATTGAGPLRQVSEPVPLAQLRADVPDSLDRLTRRCLAQSPDERPASAREVAEALRGRGGGALVVARTTCQACRAPLRVGMRLCLACGREAVQVKPGAGEFALTLTRIGDDAEELRRLRDVFDTFATATPRLNFIVGDQRLYAKEERKELHQLPTRLFGGLAEADARALATRLDAEPDKKQAIRVKVVDEKRIRRRRKVGTISAVAGGVGVAAGLIGMVVSSPLTFLPLLLVAMFALAIGAGVSASSKRWLRPAIAELRPAAAALPAGDPLVTRLARLLAEAQAADVKERLAELALQVQRIADHRARLAGAGVDDAVANLELVLAPLARVVGSVEREVRAIAALDRELGELDEGVIVRALATSEARGEPLSRRRELLGGLDRLRSLEDRRTQALGRLLEAGALLRRAAEHALTEGAEAQAHEAEVARALAALGES